MLTDLQKKTAQAIINIFETSKVVGDYSSVVCVAGDAGGLTYGKSQTTINSGNLYLLIKAYVETDGAEFANELRPYLQPLRDRDPRLCNDTTLHRILRQAGSQDSVMIETQDAFFDRVYWEPAVRQATRIGVQTPLGTAVVYDSMVHGSWGRMRDRTNNRHGKLSDIGEKTWISHYVDVRRQWLASFSGLLRRTVYRMDAFRKLITNAEWDLNLPLNVRGLQISEETLQGSSAIRIVEFSRLLYLTRPYMTGQDVQRVQQALEDRGFQLSPGVDGIFGPSTDAAVKAFQEQNGLVVDGIVGPATRSALGLDDN